MSYMPVRLDGSIAMSCSSLSEPPLTRLAASPSAQRAPAPPETAASGASAELATELGRRVCIGGVGPPLCFGGVSCFGLGTPMFTYYSVLRVVVHQIRPITVCDFADSLRQTSAGSRLSADPWICSQKRRS